MKLEAFVTLDGSPCVVPYIGTWIETGLYVNVIKRGAVVPYIGTWIETGLYVNGITLWFSSLI